MKKTISFVNPNFQQGPKALNAFYLPYTSGVLWEYAKTDPAVAEQFDLNQFVWRRDHVDKVIEKIKHDAVVAFSVYLWNNSYCNVLAKKLREVNPDVLIIFGGPQPPIEDPDFFEHFPYVDIMVKTEGEITFQKILQHYNTKQFKDIPGMLVNEKGNTVDTGNAVRIKELDIIPSPYLSGLFDDLIKDYPEINWTGTFETNRGCPYQCTFCDWGSLTYAKVKQFHMDRVFAELEWFGQNQIDFISITDANFGIFPERDKAIAKKIVEVQQKYDNPKGYTISWAKNQRAEVIDIVKILMFEGGSTLGLNLSVQSLDENTLEIIKRKNLSMNRIEEVFDECEVNNIPLYTELILGLPGETLQSWKQNFFKLYESGNHTGITVYQAQLLENAEMNLTQRNLYDIKGTVVYDYLVGSYNENELREGIEVVTSTLNMPRSDMIAAHIVSWFQITFHINGITNYLSRFIRKFTNNTYEEFYDKLFEYLSHDPWFQKELHRIESHYEGWLNKGKIDHAPIQGMEIHGWNLIHSSNILIHHLQNVDYIFDLLTDFMQQNYSEIDSQILTDLIEFQRRYVIDAQDLHSYPKQVDLDHDILGYIQNDSDINLPTSYKFDFPENKDMSLETFCEKIFFDRRKNFGKAWISKNTHQPFTQYTQEVHEY